METLEITEFQPDERLEVNGALVSSPVHLTYQLRGTGDVTTLVNTVELQPRGRLRLLVAATGNRVERAVADNLVVLKTHLEEGRAP